MSDINPIHTYAHTHARTHALPCTLETATTSITFWHGGAGAELTDNAVVATKAEIFAPEERKIFRIYLYFARDAGLNAFFAPCKHPRLEVFAALLLKNI